MAKHLNVRKLIIVSSVKSNAELTVSMKLAKTTGAHKLLPTQWIKNLESLALFVLDPLFDLRLKLIRSIFQRDPAYLDWSINEIVHWSQTEPPQEVIHIHGDKDVVFPIKNIDTSHHFYRIKMLPMP